MKNQFDQELGDRLMRYAAIDSQSDEDSVSTPSTEVQFDVLRLLEKELSKILFVKNFQLISRQLSTCKIMA